MTKIKIPILNIMRHKGASLILVIIFALTSFVFYWAFGYTNMVSSILEKSYHDSYGDFVFFTSFYDKKKVNELLSNRDLKKVILEREIRGILENPQKSDFVILSELNLETSDRLKRYIRPVKGSLPKNADEIVVSEFLKEGVFEVGDVVFVTTTTPNKIINTKRYTISGITKSSGWKGFGSSFLISEQSMSDLIGSNTQGNLIYVDLDKQKYNTREKITKKYEEIKKFLESNKIEIKDSWLTQTQLDKLAGFAVLFNSLKSFLMIIFFPLVGAVVAAIVWMYAFRRRKEIWTYSALGLKNRGIVFLMASEYLFLTAIGLFVGILMGALTGFWMEQANIWFRFSYTFVSPLMLEITSSDIIGIILFLFICVTIWMIPPLRRIINSPLFRY